MTCIVGVEHGGKVWVGGDNLGSNGAGDAGRRRDEKVFKAHGMVFGFTSSFRMGQLLRYSLDLPKLPERVNERWMVREFVGGVRKCLAEGGFRKKENEVEQGGTFIVGVQGQLFVVHRDYQIERPSYGYTAVGSGDECAVGALHALANLNGKLDPKKRVIAALSAAEEHKTNVRRPFKVLSA